MLQAAHRHRSRSTLIVASCMRMSAASTGGSRSRIRKRHALVSENRRSLMFGRISPPRVEPFHAEARRRGARRRRCPILARMKSRLVWTSDPEAAKRLREEGVVDARGDQGGAEK